MTESAHWKVAVFEDGAGSFQARCLHCDWRGPWQEHGSKATRNSRALADAKAHGAGHAEAEAVRPADGPFKGQRHRLAIQRRQK